MSIREIIRDCCKKGELFPINPFPGDPLVRELYVSKEIYEMLMNEADKDAAWGAAKAIMEGFVAGQTMSVRKHNLKRDKKKAKIMFAQLEPRKNWTVWEIRASSDISPAIRILGQFAEKDLFIALEWRPRADLATWKQRSKSSKAGDFQSNAWKQIIRNCKAKWRGLFHSYKPLAGDDKNDFISRIILI